MEKTIRVSGMHCSSCKMLIEEVSGEIHGVEKVSADFENGEVSLSVENESVLPKVRKAIEEVGYKVIG